MLILCVYSFQQSLKLILVYKNRCLFLNKLNYILVRKLLLIKGVILPRLLLTFLKGLCWGDRLLL